VENPSCEGKGTIRADLETKSQKRGAWGDHGPGALASSLVRSALLAGLAFWAGATGGRWR
jgi:hypothetical protein